MQKFLRITSRVCCLLARNVQIILISTFSSVLTGCSNLGIVHTSIASEFPLTTITDVDTATQARQRVLEERQRITLAAGQRRTECYQMFYANNCLNDLRQDELQAEQALFAVDIEARRIIREARFNEDAARLASKQEQATRDQATQAAERAQKAEDYQRRQQAQAVKQQQVEIEAALASQRGVQKRRAIEAKIHAKSAAEIAAEQAFMERTANRLEYEKKLEEARQHAADMEKKRIEKQKK